MLENKDEVLEDAKKWFRETIVDNYAKNAVKLVDASQFVIII